MKFQERVSKVFMIAGVILPLSLFNPLTASGQNNGGSRYAWDQESPFFKHCNVMLLNAVDTGFQVEVYDPNGTVPDTISELRVTHPDGTTHHDFTPSHYFWGNIYWFSIPGPPTVGEYTFTITDTEGHTATTYFYYGGGPELPIPNAATLQASGDASGATLSWGGLAGYEGNVFYRARIFGQAGNIIWTSGFTPGTSLGVPGDIINQVLQDPGPTWRVEAFDNHAYITSYLRSSSDQVDLEPDNSSPYFDFAWIHHRKDGTDIGTQVEVRVKDPDGTVPSSIQSLEVKNSSGQLVCSLDHADAERRLTYIPAFNEFLVVIPGSLTAGVYRFDVVDNQGKIKRTYDYLGPSIDIPVVDSATYQALGDPLSPILSWAAPAGMDRPYYYRVIIEDSEGVRAWGSNIITETAVQVPSGVLQSGVSYRWYVRTKDNRYYGHYNHRGSANALALAVNPNPNPFFRWAGVHRRHDADGAFTGLSAAVIDPAADLPGSLTSLTVQPPEGDAHVLVTGGVLESGVFYDPSSGEFFFRAPGSFQPGVYTFTLVKGGFTLVSYDWVGNSPEMPLVDQTSIAVSGDPAAPTLSWSGVSGFQGNVYYRLRVDDNVGNIIHRTSRDPLTAQTIPTGKVQPGRIYLACVEAQEHPDWVTYNTRSNTAFVWWFSDGDIMTMENAIAGLQVLAGLNPAIVHHGADVNKDGKIGPEEVLYILQYLAGLRP